MWSKKDRKFPPVATKYLRLNLDSLRVLTDIARGTSMIETLGPENRSEVEEAIASAFVDHPMLPVDPSGSKSRLMAETILNTFAQAPDAHTFGIRQDGKVDCAAFVYDGKYEPRGWTLVTFGFRMLQIAGWRMLRSLPAILSAKHTEGDRQLELMLLGTRTDCQAEGLGRQMLRHVIEFARVRSYDAVVLEVAKETPAYPFYLREGFQLEKEVDLPSMPLCLLRCPIEVG